MQPVNEAPTERPIGGVSVVTTCYNERENIGKLIPDIRQVLAGISHEIIVVDDSSPDRTIDVARQLADVAVLKKREGQTCGLAEGMRLAKYDAIVTMDSDLENEPKWMLALASMLADFDVMVASRPSLPRISERIFAAVYRKQLGVRDVLSNYRAYRRSIVSLITPARSETFGAEFLIRAHKLGLRIGEIVVEPQHRRLRPRIGNTVTANLRILMALIRTSRIN
jgi:dolichol-phosphate mannosyltransferase